VGSRHTATKREWLVRVLMGGGGTRTDGLGKVTKQCVSRWVTPEGTVGTQIVETNARKQEVRRRGKRTERDGK